MHAQDSGLHPAKIKQGVALEKQTRIVCQRNSLKAARDAYRPNLQLVQFSNDAGTG